MSLLDPPRPVYLSGTVVGLMLSPFRNSLGSGIRVIVGLLYSARASPLFRVVAGLSLVRIRRDLPMRPSVRSLGRLNLICGIIIGLMSMISHLISLTPSTIGFRTIKSNLFSLSNYFLKTLTKIVYPKAFTLVFLLFKEKLKS